MSFLGSDLLVNAVHVDAPSFAKDASGGVKQTWARQTTTSLRCSIQPNRGNASRQFGQRQIFISHIFYFDQDPQVKRGYRLQDEVTGDYYVVFSIENIAGRSELWQVEATLQTSL